MALAQPSVAPNAPSARAKAAPENSARSNGVPVANSTAPPTPCSARNNSSASAVLASAHASDPPVNMTRPTRNSRRRPSRSPRVAAGSNSTASTRAYAALTHCRSGRLARRSRWIDGRATLTTVISSNNMNAAAHTSTRVHRCRDDVSAPSAIGPTAPGCGRHGKGGHDDLVRLVWKRTPLVRVRRSGRLARPLSVAFMVLESLSRCDAMPQRWHCRARVAPVVNPGPDTCHPKDGSPPVGDSPPVRDPSSRPGATQCGDSARRSGP